MRETLYKPDSHGNDEDVKEEESTERTLAERARATIEFNSRNQDDVKNAESNIEENKNETSSLSTDEGNGEMLESRGITKPSPKNMKIKFQRRANRVSLGNLDDGDDDKEEDKEKEENTKIKKRGRRRRSSRKRKLAESSFIVLMKMFILRKHRKSRNPLKSLENTHRKREGNGRSCSLHSRPRDAYVVHGDNARNKQMIEI